MAFELIKKNLCGYVIAYNSGVGKDIFAPNFSYKFYGNLVQKDEGTNKHCIEESFFCAKQSMNNSEYSDVPVIYKKKIF